MRQMDLIQSLNDLGIHTKAHFYAEAFSRNIGLFTPTEQTKLSEATVAIPGMGGVGGVHLMTLARMGIGKFHIADFDTFDAVNINRQYGAKVPNFGKSKLEIMRDEALSVNPYAEIKTFPEGITASNLDQFLEGVDVVVDGLDYFEFDIRRMLFNRAREKGIYVITAGPMGFSSAMLIFSPHEGMGFDEYFNIIPGMTPEDHYLSYGLGLSPRPTQIRYMDLSRVDLSGKAGPSSIIACQLCAGTAANEAMRIILKRGKIFAAPYYFQFDPYRYIFRKGKLRGGNRNPLQKVKLAVVKKILATRQKTIKPVIPEIPRIPRMEAPSPRIGTDLYSASRHPGPFRRQCPTLEIQNPRECPRHPFGPRGRSLLFQCEPNRLHHRLRCRAGKHEDFRHSLWAGGRHSYSSRGERQRPHGIDCLQR